MDHSQFEALFRAIIAENGLNSYVLPPFIQQFETFTNLFQAENAITNLSAIRKTPDMIAKHYADCLLADSLIPQGATVLDVGCGGGFPCIPLAIVRPDLRITAIDSTQKKVDFVKKAGNALGLSNLTVLCGRIEEQEQWRERFDLVTSRAVANLPVLAEITIPFVKTGGSLLALKGAKGSEEAALAQTAIQTLGGVLTADHAKTLACPAENGQFEREERHLLVVTKQKPTPQTYPRAYAAILKRPL